MQLNNIQDISPDFLTSYRTELGLSLGKFWGAIGCERGRGFRYEHGTTEIPESIKRLLVLHYGVGIPTDCQSEDFLNFAAAMRQSNPFRVGQAAKLIREAHHLLVGDGL